MDQAERMLAIIERNEGRALTGENRELCLAGFRWILEEEGLDPSGYSDEVLAGQLKKSMCGAKASRN